MAASRHDPYPDLRTATPRRQLLTVSELEQLFGPDATVELRSTRPEHVEADLEVVAPRRTSRWMAPVLIVVFAAASLLGYALLRNSAPVEAAWSVRNWLGNTSLGPTAETPVEVDYRLPPLVAKITSSPGSAVAPPVSEAPAADAAPPTVVPSVEPASPPEEPQAKPETEPAVKSKPAAPRAGRAKPARRVEPAVVPYPQVGREADDRATQQLIEREVERLGDDSTPAREPSESGETYPPGYIEAEIK